MEKSETIGVYEHILRKSEIYKIKWFEINSKCFKVYINFKSDYIGYEVKEKLLAKFICKKLMNVLNKTSDEYINVTQIVNDEIIKFNKRIDEMEMRKNDEDSIFYKEK